MGAQIVPMGDGRKLVYTERIDGYKILYHRTSSQYEYDITAGDMYIVDGTAPTLEEAKQKVRRILKRADQARRKYQHKGA